MKNIILVGGGGHCESCIDVIEAENKFQIKGILDVPEKVGEKILDYSVIGTDDDIEKYSKQDCYFLITVGQIQSSETRIKLFEQIKKSGGKLATVISPDAYISKYAKIGEGTIIMHKVFVNAGVEIGNNCIINTNAIIEHDCKIEDNCHMAIAAVIAGGAKIEQGSFIGANSTVVQCVNVPQNSFIKAGSLVK